MNTFEIGTIVKGFYKTGAYIGEVTDVRPNHYLVKIKAVLTHPAQGDLHHPKQADVPFFMKEERLHSGNRQTYRIRWSNRLVARCLIIRLPYKRRLPG